jgi:hypothetical protein
VVATPDLADLDSCKLKFDAVRDEEALPVKGNST